MLSIALSGWRENMLREQARDYCSVVKLHLCNKMTRKNWVTHTNTCLLFAWQHVRHSYWKYTILSAWLWICITYLFLKTKRSNKLTQKCQGLQFSLNNWFTFSGGTVKVNWNILQQINRAINWRRKFRSQGQYINNNGCSHDSNEPHTHTPLLWQWLTAPPVHHGISRPPPIFPTFSPLSKVCLVYFAFLWILHVSAQK